MSIWIITTGSSDIQLKTDEHWSRGDKLYSKHNNQEPLTNCDEFSSLEHDKKTQSYPLPSRVLGLVYKKYKEHYQDLKFRFFYSEYDKLSIKIKS
jgi:hypothetical protein